MSQRTLGNAKRTVRSIDPASAAVSVVLALVPGVVFLVMWILAIWDWALPAAIVAWALFTWSVYNRERLTGRVGAVIFWLSIEALLAPIVYVAWWFRTPPSGGKVTIFEELAGAGVFVLGAFFCLIIGGVLYLISRRLEQ